MTMRFLLPGEAVRTAGRQAAPRRGHRPAHRGAAGRSGGVRVELRAAQRRRRRRARRHRRRSRSEQDEQPDIVLIGVTPRFLQDAGRDADSAAATSPTPRAARGRRSRSINQTMAQRFWPNGRSGRRPLPARLRGEENNWFTVIGVANDIKLDDVDPENPAPPAAAYVPYAYQQTLNTGLTIRVAGEPAGDHRRGPARDPRLGSEPADLPGADDGGGPAAAASGSTGCSAGSSGRSASSACCSPRSASTACCRTRSRSASQEIGVRVALGARTAARAAADRRAGRAAGRRSASAIGLVLAPPARASGARCSTTSARSIRSASRRWRCSCWSSRSSPATCPRGARRRSIRWSRCEANSDKYQSS